MNGKLNNGDELPPTIVEQEMGDVLPAQRPLPPTQLELERGLLAWLVIVEGQPRGEAFRLGLVTTIGRDADCDLRLDDTAVSGHHARVSLEADRVVIQDLGSTNGVRVYAPARQQWEKVNRQVLGDGARIQLGRTVLHLMVVSADMG